MILRVTGFQFLSLHAAYKIQETASLTLPGINTIVYHCSMFYTDYPTVETKIYVGLLSFSYLPILGFCALF